LSGESATRIAIALLRSGRPVRLGGGEDLTVTAVETTTAELLTLRDPDNRARLRIERGELSGVRRLDGQQRERPDRDGPAAAQCVDRARDGPVAQKANSVTSGTWSEGFNQLRQGSWTACARA
jgi:GTP cyclohydrolase II